jgi:hypothetical protein
MGWVVNAMPRPLNPREKPGTHCTGGPVWTGGENLASTGIRSPDRPAYGESLYRLRYPYIHICMNVLINNNIQLLDLCHPVQTTGLQQTPFILNSYFLSSPGWMTVQDWWNDNPNSLGDTQVPVLPCKPQISHGVPWEQRQRDQRPKQWYRSTKRRTHGCDSGRTSVKQGREFTTGRTARCLRTSTYNCTF